MQTTNDSHVTIRGKVTGSQPLKASISRKCCIWKFELEGEESSICCCSFMSMAEADSELAAHSSEVFPEGTEVEVDGDIYQLEDGSRQLTVRRMRAVA